MNEILFLSSLLVGVSGIFLIAGFLEHQKAIQLMEIMENLSDGSVKYEGHEGTDSE